MAENDRAIVLRGGSPIARSSPPKGGFVFKNNPEVTDMVRRFVIDMAWDVAVRKMRDTGNQIYERASNVFKEGWDSLSPSEKKAFPGKTEKAVTIPSVPDRTEQQTEILQKRLGNKYEDFLKEFDKLNQTVGKPAVHAVSANGAQQFLLQLSSLMIRDVVTKEVRTLTLDEAKVFAYNFALCGPLVASGAIDEAYRGLKAMKSIQPYVDDMESGTGAIFSPGYTGVRSMG